MLYYKRKKSSLPKRLACLEIEAIPLDLELIAFYFFVTLVKVVILFSGAIVKKGRKYTPVSICYIATEDMCSHPEGIRLIPPYTLHYILTHINTHHSLNIYFLKMKVIL